MRGHHQQHRDLLGEGVHLAVVEAARAEVGHGLGEGLAGPGGASPATYPMVLLGEVHELEMEGEGPQCEVAAVRVERRDRRAQLNVVPQPPVFASAARELSQPVDHGHGRIALLLEQHPREQIVKQREIAREVGGEGRWEGAGGVGLRHPDKARRSRSLRLRRGWLCDRQTLRIVL